MACLTPQLTTIRSGSYDLAVWEWPGSGPPLLFAHATGFHGRIWDSIVHVFPGCRAIAPDFRGHGRSGKPEPPYQWRWFAEDTIAVADHFGLRGAIGVGHSMGGHSLVEAAAMRPEIFSSLVLVDPVIYAPERYGETGGFDPSFIERRRARWSSPGEMYERFAGRPPFANWKPEILRDYCDYGLLPDGDAFILACPPVVEASIYRNSRAAASNLHSVLASVDLPVTVMRAGSSLQPGVFDLSASPTWEHLAAQFPRGRDVHLADRNHYIPMEAPEVVAQEVSAQLARRTAG
jgi:pimeloyl-ACP methyl ester carboxylesterase